MAEQSAVASLRRPPGRHHYLRPGALRCRHPDSVEGCRLACCRLRRRAMTAIQRPDRVCLPPCKGCRRECHRRRMNGTGRQHSTFAPSNVQRNTGTTTPISAGSPSATQHAMESTGTSTAVITHWQGLTQQGCSWKICGEKSSPPSILTSGEISSSVAGVTLSREG